TSQADMPEIEDIVPLSIKLRVRLATLENRLKDELNFFELETTYDAIEAKIADQAGELRLLKASQDYKEDKLVVLSESIKTCKTWKS
ncbi:MAG: hypothetical protein JRL30_22710, partial [Deltaproteobacteria bacterium]|nr:hypothetical protein [Deltaproteobacteria bacterium]